MKLVERIFSHLVDTFSFSKGLADNKQSDEAAGGVIRTQMGLLAAQSSTELALLAIKKVSQ